MTRIDEIKQRLEVIQNSPDNWIWYAVEDGDERMDFIEQAPSDMRYLLAEIERQQAAIQAAAGFLALVQASHPDPAFQQMAADLITELPDGT